LRIVPAALLWAYTPVFALLALAMVALALSVLQDEKQRSHRVHAEGLKRDQAQISACARVCGARAREARACLPAGDSSGGSGECPAAGIARDAYGAPT
jgi:hypothetical protein